MQFWQPCQTFLRKVRKSENCYTIVFFSQRSSSSSSKSSEWWSARLTSCWTNVCQISENMSLKVGKFLQKNLIKLKNFLPGNLFWECRTKDFNLADFFFENIFFCPKAESKKNNEKFPRKLCSSTKSLRTRRLELWRQRQNFLQTFRRKSALRSEKNTTK